MITIEELANVRPAPDVTVWVQGAPKPGTAPRCQRFVRATGHDPILAREIRITFRPDVGQTIDLSGAKLVPHQTQRYQTRFGDSPDFISATFRPGRNVIALTAGDRKAVCQVQDWQAVWLRLQIMGLVAAGHDCVRGQAAADVLHELSLARLVVTAR